MQPLLHPRTSPTRVAHHVRAAVAVVALAGGIGLAFLWAPVAVIPLAGGGSEPDIAQKIFYVHVPVAFAAYWCFIVGAWNAVLHLRSGNAVHDLRSYVAIHVGMVFGTLVLITGSLWARAAWGTWWQWGDRQLIVFLVLYLFYTAYFMVRFSIEDGGYRARVSSIVALLGIALVPLSFLAIRIADTLIHPTVIESDGLAMPASMAVAFIVSSVGFLALAELMMQLESAVKVRGMARLRPRGASATITLRPIDAAAKRSPSHGT